MSNITIDPDSIGIDDIEEKYKEKIYIQDYSSKKIIEGVKIVEIKNFVGEDGDFSEVLRFNETGEVEGFPDFKLAQVNRTKVYSGIIKAWHLHFKQDEIWYLLPDNHIILGLWDLRKNSSTNDLKMKIGLGGGKSQLVFIPKGVAHGCSNITKRTANVIYFMNQKFDVQNPDEQRLSWDILGNDFWKPKRD